MAVNPYETDLDKNAANYQSLTPLTFLERSASVYPRHTAIVHGQQRIDYATFYRRSRQLASALAAVVSYLISRWIVFPSPSED